MALKVPPPSLVWPTLLTLPPGDVLIVYFDLNHWVGLAQASVGHPKGAPFVDVLQACRSARAAGTATFVLSGTIYAETQKIKDPAQRQSLAAVMEELTNFDTLVSRVVVMECEFSAMLDPIAKRPSPLAKASLIGRGVRHAYGISSGFSIMGPSGDETESFRQRFGSEAFDEFMSSSFLKMERDILRGPVNSDDEKSLRVLPFRAKLYRVRSSPASIHRL